MADLHTRTCHNLGRLLQNSPPAGIPAEQLCCDFRNKYGTGIPFRQLGFDTLSNFLYSLPSICRVTPIQRGGVIVKPVDVKQLHSEQKNNEYNNNLQRNNWRRQKPQQPQRRPKQQSTAWVPPQPLHQQTPLNPNPYKGAPKQQYIKKGVQFSQHIINERRPQTPTYNNQNNSYPKLRREKTSLFEYGRPQEQQPRMLQRQNSSLQDSKRTFNNSKNMENNMKRRSYFGEVTENRINELLEESQPRSLGGHQMNTFGNENERKSLRKPKRKEQEFYTPGRRSLKGTPNPSSTSSSNSTKSEAAQDDLRIKLQAFFTDRNLGQVPYKTTSLGNGRFVSMVTVNGETYKTYPQNYLTQDEAEDAVAKKILDNIDKIEAASGFGNQNISVNNNVLLFGDRVLQILEEKLNGVWSSKVENEYFQKHGEKLSHTWIEEMEKLGLIRKECPIPDSIRFIIFALGQNLAEKLPPSLCFPSKNIWDIYVVGIRSTVSTQMRIIGDDFSDKLSSLQTDMDAFFSQEDNKRGVLDPVVGKIYAAHTASAWHRVQVEEIFDSQCVCFFIDHGDSEIVKKDDLVLIPLKFLLLPPQVMETQLAGLEDYRDCDSVTKDMTSILLGKSFVAKVENEEVLGTKYSKKETTLPRLIIFDTSSETEDVNINKKLIEMKVLVDSHASLPAPGSEEVKVVLHEISEEGELFVRKVTQDGNTEEQSISCRLSGVPPPGHSWSEDATDALRDLVPENQVVSLKVVEVASDISYVELNLPESCDGSINFDLSTEFDIFPLSTTEIHKNDKNNNGPESLTPTLPEIGSIFDLKVTFAVSPKNFVIQIYDKGEGLDKITKELALHFGLKEMQNTVDEENDIDEIEILLANEKIFAVKNSDGNWQRVEVTSSLPGDQVVARYIDQGGVAVLSKHDIKQIPMSIKELPHQAISAFLSSVSPICDDWSPEDNFWFNQRVSDKLFVGHLKSVTEAAGESEGEGVVVGLELVDTSHHTEDIYIHKLMIEEGRAKADTGVD